MLTRRKHATASMGARIAARQTGGSSKASLAKHLRDLETALHHDTAGVTIFDGSGKLTYVNQSFPTVYGLAGNQAMVGLTVEGLEALLAPACIRKADVQACLLPSHTGRTKCTQEQLVITLSSGRVLQVCHYPQDGGWVTRHIVAGDINSQSTFTDELISLQALIDQVPDYLWVKDTEGRFVVANLALTLDSGRDKSSDMIGLTDFDLHSAAAATRFRNKEREILLTGEAMIDEEEAIIDSSGHEKWFSSSKIPLRNKGGEIIGLIGSARDITARKKAEALRLRAVELEKVSRELAEALEREQQVNALQRQFVAMASHEFRTPLAIIDGAAQRLVRRRGEVDPHFVADKSQQIRLAVGRMVELMESILSFGKLESGHVEFEPEECSVRDILSICCERQQELSKAHDISLDLGTLPRTIVADRSALEQVFTNLLSNAVKYSPRSPKIEVRGWCDGSDVRVSIQDYGLGIDPDDLPKMFERYFRARTSSGIAGTGIGLNLVKQIVELHGGQVTVDSRKGEGSLFAVSLPIAGPHRQLETA